MNNTYRQHGKNSGYTSFDGKKLKTMKAFSAVFALVVMGLMLFMMGTFAERSIENHKNQCTVPVKAVVKDFVRSNKENSSDVAPIYEFNFYGTKYSVKSNSYLDPNLYDIGDTADIYINPLDPNIIFNPEDGADESITNIFKIIGFIIWGLAGLVIIITIVKNVFIRVPVNHLDDVSDKCVDEVSTFEESSDCIDEVSVYDETDGYQ